MNDNDCFKKKTDLKYYDNIIIIMVKSHVICRKIINLINTI